MATTKHEVVETLETKHRRANATEALTKSEDGHDNTQLRSRRCRADNNRFLGLDPALDFSSITAQQMCPGTLGAQLPASSFQRPELRAPSPESRVRLLESRRRREGQHLEEQQPKNQCDTVYFSFVGAHGAASSPKPGDPGDMAIGSPPIEASCCMFRARRMTALDCVRPGAHALQLGEPIGREEGIIFRRVGPKRRDGRGNDECAKEMKESLVAYVASPTTENAWLYEPFEMTDRRVARSVRLSHSQTSVLDCIARRHETWAAFRDDPVHAEWIVQGPSPGSLAWLSALSPAGISALNKTTNKDDVQAIYLATSIFASSESESLSWRVLFEIGLICEVPPDRAHACPCFVSYFSLWMARMEPHGKPSANS
ncbi:hypothetical protein EDB81DRAFT_856111 [Dactylonectria macrodidyma]|uniref:Uncharacterized protein n=1 Tax=Dactylonectria macrodidyma TaxID=307937 RepID=A0A9P9EV09_9HYPO|nr:hypothetical protein EDB81DRAFT_856111 [Dactylonectria macrodidyma]